MTDPWDAQMEALGGFIRSQRKLAKLSLRQLAELSSLSNAYLSQLERGMHQPSFRVLKLLSGALDVSAEMLLAQAGLLDLLPADPASGDGATKNVVSGDGAAAEGMNGDGVSADAAALAESVEEAVGTDDRLDDEQKAALLAVYRSMLRP
jgi:transcriptional regulator with XRE-family HTH domain